jgi:pilus assembly protein CpaE
VSVILVTDRESEVAVPAMRAGVRDVVSASAEPADLREALDRAASNLAIPTAEAAAAPGTGPVNQSQVGTVITVASPKGGVGKTTVATNLAVGIAQRVPQGAVLVDLDVHFGDVASALNLTPEYTLPDIAHGPAARDSLAVKTYLTRHETGLFVVPGSNSPAASDTVTPSDVHALIDTLRTQFAYVIVDTSPGLAEHTLAAFDRTSVLVLVTSLDVPGVRGLRVELDTLSDLGLHTGSRHIVLNFNDAHRGLSVADVEATIRAKVDVVVPQSNLVPLSVNQGIPLLQSGGRDPVTKHLQSLVDAIVPPSKAPRGLFGRRVRS